MTNFAGYIEKFLGVRYVEKINFAKYVERANFIRNIKSDNDASCTEMSYYVSYIEKGNLQDTQNWIIGQDILK